MNQVEQLIQSQHDLDARLRAVEGGQRNGLSSLRNAWMTAAATQAVFGTIDAGPVGATWEDDQGNVGTGFPSVTVAGGARVMIEWNARPIGIANDPNYRSLSVSVRVLVNGVPFDPLLPTTARQFANGNAAPVDATISASVIKLVQPGENTYQLMATFADDQPAAVNLPTLTDVQLMVTPLGFG